MNKKLSVVLFVILFSAVSFTQLIAQDKEFWFAAPDASYAHSGCDSPTFLMITTGAEPAVVTISIGVNGSAFKRTESIPAYSFYKETFVRGGNPSIDLVENFVTNGGLPENKGIHIKSNVPVSAYYQVDGNCSKDIYALKSDKALGLEFYVPMQDKYAVQALADAYDQINIVATENNTNITITPTGNVFRVASAGGNVLANKPFTVKLNKGQSYLVREAVRNQTPSLNGTHIVSDLPIAVTVTEDPLYSSGNYDIVGDQLVPVNNLGTSYILINGFTSSPAKDYAYILATKDDTEVYLNGNTTTPVATLDKGKSWCGEIAVNSALYISTSKPAYCYQMSGYGNELGSALIPSMYSISARRIGFYKQNMPTNSLFLIFRKGTHDKFKLNGGAYTVTPVNIPGIDDWKFAKVNINIASVPIGLCTVENTESTFALGYFNYGNGTASYGFLSGFGDFTLGGDTTRVCGASYKLDAGYAKSYKWTLPDGSIQTTASITATQTGKYKVTIDQDPNMVTDSTYLIFQTFDPILDMPKKQVQLGSSHTFSATAKPGYNVTYEWNFGEGANIPTGNTQKVENVSWSTEGVKEIRLIITNVDRQCDTLVIKKLPVLKFPDNISDEHCFVEPKGTEWSIKEGESYPKDPITSEVFAHSMSTPLIVDLNGDKYPEIIVPRRHKNNYALELHLSDGFLIIDGKTKEERTFKTANFNIAGQSVTIANVDPHVNNVATIFLQGADMKIYSYNGVTGAEKVITPNPLPYRYVLHLADINNDGTPELIAGNYIFNAVTGNLLLNFPLEANGKSIGFSHNYAQEGYIIPAVGDIDGDGDLEIVAGNTVYNVYIKPNSNSVSGNTCSTLTADTHPFITCYDGQTVLVDFDLDGTLDVVVIAQRNYKIQDNVQVYVWNGQTSEILGYAPVLPLKCLVTIPYVGNLDETKYPEVVFGVADNAVGGTGTGAMHVYTYDETVPGKIKLKGRQTALNETAGFTLFDFNQDKKSEIVARNDKALFIVDGTTLTKKGTEMASYSGTVTEYPVVADIDGDGSAEIVITRCYQPWGGGGDPQQKIMGAVTVYRSDNGSEGWAPARKIWNQWPYNAVNINEDATVPKIQFDITTVFPGDDGMNETRPYNGYLMQQTTLSRKGEPLYLTPNVQIVNPEGITYDYNMSDDILTINNLKVKNSGSATLTAPLMITVYKDIVATTTDYSTFSADVSIGIDETETIVVTIPKFSELLPVNNLIIQINDSGKAKEEQLVCESSDGNESDSFINIEFDVLAWADAYRKSEGDNVNFDSKPLPGASVEYKWFKPDGVSKLADGRTASINNLTTDHAGKYIFRASKINNGPLSVNYTLPYLSVAPSEMKWSKEAKDNDWNNINNWIAFSASGDPVLAVPSERTNVCLPSISDNFPSLNDGENETDYLVYGNPTVKNITFHHGSQLAHQHRLSYKKAFVQYNWGYFNGVYSSSYPGENEMGNAAPKFSRNSWYAISSPLKNVASGDFSLSGYPMTWQARFNPNGAILDFSNAITTNDMRLSDNNNVIAVKVSHYQSDVVGAKDHKNMEGLKGILEFPYFETPERTNFHTSHRYDTFRKESKFFYFDSETLQALPSPVSTMKRGDDSYRFIYENAMNEAPTITVNGGSVKGYEQTVNRHNTGSQLVMIGNPFVAPINAEAFWKANVNSSINKTAGYNVFDSSTQTWSRKDFNASNVINPLQAFVVTLENGKVFTKILFPLEGESALTRSASAEIVPTDEFRMKVSDTNGLSGDYAVLDVNEEETDVRKLLYPEGHQTPEVFFVSNDTDRRYNLIQHYENGVNELSIGVKYSKTHDPLSLSFENLDSFLGKTEGVRVVLVDKLLNIEQDLSNKSEYKFLQRKTSADNHFVDNERFTLRFADANDEFFETTNIQISYIDNTLNVISNNDIDAIAIYSLSGSIVYREDAVGTNTYRKNVTLQEGAYIVKVKTVDNKTKSSKIIVLLP